MKKILFMLAASLGAAPAIAQTAHHDHADSLLSRFVIDINLLGGGATQTFTTANTAANYPGALNMNTGQLTYKNGYSFGADGQVGLFFGRKRHFGLGTGIMFMEQHGDAMLNNYHVEYQATDGSGNIFRQLVTGNDIRETITTQSMNIPIVLKYKNRFSKHWGFTADAGAVLNLQMNNAYTTHASFDYEAIYKLTKTSDGGTVSSYDNAPVPAAGDWLITKAEFYRNNPNGNLQDYFNAKRALGYSVGDGLSPASAKGSTSYTTGSLGFLVQPSINYFLSDNVALNFGAYYMFQPFKNNAQTSYRLTDGIGNYSSVTNNITAGTNQSYGLNIGARFFFGRKQAPIFITSTDYSSPSRCGLCDGSITLAGLTPGKPVTVDYSVNNGQQAQYSTDVQPDGKVKIPGLCAGNYTGIVATIKRKNAMGKVVTLADPNADISSRNISNPSAAGVCDGSVTFYGKYAGKAVTINYSLNGTAQAAYTRAVNSDNSVTISGLCEGRYTGIVASADNCSANGADFTLTAPVPPPPPPPPPVAPAINTVDISTPILFDVNQTVVHGSYYSEIDEAAAELKENKGAVITIDGHADITGNEPHNRVLSQERANSVKSQFVKRGINPKRLKIRGHGSSIPAATNSTIEGRQENRRASMKITPAN